MKKIVIIGGGASGLILAATLNEAIQKQQIDDLKVTLLEANDKLGKKISASGNGRCNLSHVGIKANDYYCGESFQLQPILDSFSVEQFFEKKGLWVRNEGDLVYPNTLQAASVVHFFESQLDNIEVIKSCKVNQIDPKKHLIQTTLGNYEYDYVILCTGSKAAKQLGGNDSGYEILKKIGHAITPLYPCLVQLKSKQVPSYLKGTRIKGTFKLVRNGQAIHQEVGELLFTDYGLSGIAMFQMSRLVQKGDTIVVDAFDRITSRDLTRKLKGLVSTGEFHLEFLLPDKYARYLTSQIGKISFRNLDTIVEKMKNQSFLIDGVNDFDNAQITRGGLSLKEVNNNLASKKYPNIYICGELLDIDGPCGGYNLHFAFSSGYYVANQLINQLNKE